MSANLSARHGLGDNTADKPPIFQNAQSENSCYGFPDVGVADQRFVHEAGLEKLSSFTISARKTLASSSARPVYSKAIL
jgi:hypothetical protein